jgi:hypothetical protein
MPRFFLPFLFAAICSGNIVWADSGKSSACLVIGPVSYQYSWGMIGTSGVSTQIGWRLPSNYVGGIITWGTGTRQLNKTLIDQASFPNYRQNEYEIRRQSAGLGAVWYYEGLSIKKAVIIAPGASLGFWTLFDRDKTGVNFGTIFEFGAFRLKAQSDFGRIGIAVEGCAQFGIGKITPQASAGIIVRL